MIDPPVCHLHRNEYCKVREIQNYSKKIFFSILFTSVDRADQTDQKYLF